MKILLINTNPVVSRLLALCTRDEHMVLDEVKSVDAVEKSGYDIVFVDEAAYTDNMPSLFDGLNIRKKVLLSYVDDLMKGFDQTVKKPFLPSQIINILTEIESTEETEDTEEIDLVQAGFTETETVEDPLSVFPETTDENVEEELLQVITQLSSEEETQSEEEETADTKVLNLDEIAKIKALLDMDEDEIDLDEEELLEDESYEARKIKVIKEQLIADGLEIVEEDEIVESFSASIEKASDTSNKKMKKAKKNEKKRELSEEEHLALEKALSEAIANLKPKKIKKLLKGEEIKVKIKLEDHS